MSVALESVVAETGALACCALVAPHPAIIVTAATIKPIFMGVLDTTEPRSGKPMVRLKH